MANLISAIVAMFHAPNPIVASQLSTSISKAFRDGPPRGRRRQTNGAFGKATHGFAEQMEVGNRSFCRRAFYQHAKQFKRGHR